MKKRFATSAFVVMLGISSMFAKGVITGSVTDKETGNVIDYATVQLVDYKTNQPLTIGTSTDEAGRFELKDVPNGKYYVRISNIGSVQQEREVTVSDNTVSVGVVSLSPDSKMLQEVVVEGIRSQMRFELDKKVFTVDANIASAGASASELLESIPSVEVDQDGEVSLRGNSSVTVWINGKESGLTADNRAQILEQIPAETIESIEVITNPSAKYSPEGTAGIINIVLKQDRKGGYFGSAEISANSRGGGNVNFNFNYNDSKWDMYAGIGFRMRHNKGGSNSYREYIADDTFLESEGESKNHGNNLFLRLGATYYFTQKDNIYFNGFGMFGHSWGNSSTVYSSNVPGQWISNINTSRNSDDMRGMHFELGYNHKWSDKHYIDIMGAYNDWGGPRWNSYYQEQTYPEDVYSTLYQEQTNEMATNSWEAKIDYTNHFTDWLKMEAGYNGNYSHENSPVNTMQGPKYTDISVNPDLYNRFIYNNNITAFYLTLGGKVKAFSFSAGLRAEAWQVRAKSLAYGQTEADVEPFKKNDFALFPSAFVSWSLPKDNELQVNFTRRIRRPWGGQLNSFQNISDPTNISYGNEELQPQYSNAFELNYLKSWDYHMISFSGYLRTTEDVMERVSYIDPTSNVMYTTTANVSNSVSAGCEIVVKNSLFKNRLDLTTTANLYNYHLDAWELDFDHNGMSIPISGKKQDSFAWDIRCMANVRLPWGLSFQATGGYNSKQITAQGQREPGWSVDAGIRKTVGNWSFSLNCRDIFDSRKRHSITYGDTYWQESEGWRGGRQLRLTVKYSFGNMKAKQSKNNVQQMMMQESGSYDLEGLE